jgi:putative transposase
VNPGPKRGEGTWDEFLKQHAVSLWQCDFFSKRILTLKGIREVFVLAFLHVGTRRVVLSPATFHPDEAWVVQQTERFVEQARGQKLRVATVQRDRDSKFTKAMDQALRSRHVKVKLNGYRSPNTNAFVERFVQTIQQECLDRFVVFGEKHIDRICKEFLEHYHTERPHQGEGIDNQLLNRPKVRGRPRSRPFEDSTLLISEIRSSQRLGGLLKSYSRKAA